MAHKRFISSGISTDEDLARVAAEDAVSFLMWPFLLLDLDDWGRGKHSAMHTKLTRFPACSSLGSDDIEKAIGLFEKHKLVHCYRSGGKNFLAVRPSSWIRHQTYLTGSKREGADSSFPAPENPPWSMEEEIQMRLKMTRNADKLKEEVLLRSQYRHIIDSTVSCPPEMSADKRRQSGMSADKSCQTGMAVPSPSLSPSLETKINNRDCGYVDKSVDNPSETQSLQGEEPIEPLVDNNPQSHNGAVLSDSPDMEPGKDPQGPIISRANNIGHVLRKVLSHAPT